MSPATTTRSEKQAWEDMDVLGQSLLASTDKAVRNIGREIMATAAEMLGQLRQGIHKNPPLIVYGNPPMKTRRKRGGITLGSKSFDWVGQIGAQVYKVQYRHADDNKPYQHPFDGPAEMYAVIRDGVRPDQHDVLITGRDGQPMWEDF